MEMSLHQALKQFYAGELGQCEVRLGAFRVDAKVGSQVVEIQLGSLANIRHKVARLLQDGHELVVVKPVVRRKLIVQYDQRGGQEQYRRYSPRCGDWREAFGELVYLVKWMPHPRLTIDIVECDIEECRFPRTGKRRKPWHTNHQVLDKRLTEIVTVHRFHDRASLCQVLPTGLPTVFHTQDLATVSEIPRWLSQRIVYVLRHAQVVVPAGKDGHTCLYRRSGAA